MTANEQTYEEKVAELKRLLAEGQAERRKRAHHKYMASQAKKNIQKAKRKSQRQNRKKGRK